MARDGAGTYTFPVNSFNPAVAATDVSPTDWNSTSADLATAISASIAKDGQTVTTAVVPFAAGISADTIAEKTAAAGVTVDGLLIKDANATFPTGTWTPVDVSGASLVLSGVSAGYTVIGNLVFAYCTVTYPVTANGSQGFLGGLPFTCANNTGARQGIVSFSQTSGLHTTVISNTTTFAMYNATGAALTNASMSNSQHNFLLIYPVS